MALSLMQRKYLTEDANARSRVYQAAAVVADQIATEHAETTQPTPEQAKGYTFAQWIMAPNEMGEHARAIFQKLVNLPALQDRDTYLLLMAPNNMLTEEDTAALDQTLIDSVAGVWASVAAARVL